MAALNTNFQFGITLEFNSEDVLVENNIIDKQSSGIVFTPRPSNTVKNITIRKNLMSNIGINTKNGSFIDFGGEGYVINFDNIQVYNNTMIGDASNKNYWGIQLPNITGGYARNMGFKNNIVANTDAGWIVQANVPVAVDNLNISYNNLYGNAANNAAVWNGSVATNYTLSNNLNTVPSFGSSYYLLSGSPLIDAGVNVGLPFKGVTPDIGYFEF
jgi:polygalacturonase